MINLRDLCKVETEKTYFTKRNLTKNIKSNLKFWQRTKIARKRKRKLEKGNNLVNYGYTFKPLQHVALPLSI